MSHHKKWFLLWILIPVLAVAAFLFLSIHYLLNPNIYRSILQRSLTTALGREVSIGKAKIYWGDGVGMAFEDFRVRDRSLTFDLLHAQRLILKVKLVPLLKREIKWKRIVVDRPILRLVRDKNGQFNIFTNGPLTGEALKDTQKKIFTGLTSLFGGSLAFSDGTVFFSDESLGPSPLKTEMGSFHFELPKVAYREAFPFRITARLTHSKQEGHFSIQGTIQNISEDLDLSKGRVKAEAKIKGIDISHFWPYLKTMLPMKTISGILDGEAQYQGDFQGTFKTSVKIKFKEFLFDYPQVFSSILTPKWVNIDFDVDRDFKNLNIPRFSIELPELWVKAKARIYDIGSEDMGMEAEAHSSPFDIAEGKKYIPFRIITPKVSEPLSRAEGKGSFQVMSIRLAGKMPEIDHCDDLINAHVLSIEAKLNGAGLKLPWNFPPLEDLKGQLLFQKGHLYFKGEEGRIFHSTLEQFQGTFYELLHVPTLQIECQGKFDLMDLPSLAKTEGFPEEFSRALSSIHILSGKPSYSLSAKGLLKSPLRFQHHEIFHVSKTRFTHPLIPFPIQLGEGRVELTHKDLQWSETKVEFGNSSLRTTGSFKHGEKDQPFEIIAKGRMDLKHLFALLQTPLFPEEVRSKTNGFEALSGTTQISFKGKTLLGASDFSYEGEFSPKEVSLLQKGNDIPLVFKEGRISFSNLGIVFVKTKVQSGSSFLILDGLLKEGKISLSSQGSIDLKQAFSLIKSPLFPAPIRLQLEEIQELNGTAEVRLKWLGKTDHWIDTLREGEIRLKGVTLRHREIPVPLSHMEGSFSFTPEEIRFNEVKGKVGDSPLTVSGTLLRGSPSSPASSQGVGKGSGLAESSRRLSFQISSPQLDLDPLFPKKEEASPTSFGKIRGWLATWLIEGKMEIEQGNFRSLRYRELKAEMKTIDGKLNIRPFQFKADGGDFWGEGWVQPTERGIRFEIKPRLSNMEAKAFLRTLFQKGEEERVALTGRVHIDKVELRGEGENSQAMKESLSGSLRFEIEEGVIERFNILSKIFSILNVTQWFKGRLPDLKTKGLPYRDMTATLHVKDGIASTDDFLVDSDAMRITILGKVDLGKNVMDARIGIHPLVTIDMILSSVPIAGYILTGKDKAFVSYFYEVKGNLNDPKIEAIPFKIVEERTWGIIKRLLETPLRPFQKNSSSHKEKK